MIIRFSKYKKLGLLCSAALVGLSVLIILIKQFNFSIDFKGGIVLEFAQTGRKVTVEEMRSTLKNLAINDSTVQEAENGRVMIVKAGFGGKDGEEASERAKRLRTQIIGAFPHTDFVFEKIDYVSPQIGRELAWKAIFAVLASFTAIIVYVSIRFEFNYSIGALMALFHDITITLGFISILGLPFDIATIAAILTVIGYSINDSVVIFDRIRHNMREYKKEKLEEILDLSLNGTLSRTLITSFTTLLAISAIVLVGGPVIRPFGLIVFFGVLVGTLSSIFIAPYLIKKREDEKRLGSKT